MSLAVLKIAGQRQLIPVDGDVEGGLDQVMVAHFKGQIDQQVATRLDLYLSDAFVNHPFGPDEAGQVQFEGLDGFGDRQVYRRARVRSR